MEKVQHYRDEVAKTKSKAYGRLYMANMYGGADKLQEAVETGEVKIVHGEDGTELFQMTSFEIHKNKGRRTELEEGDHNSLGNEEKKGGAGKIASLLVVLQ